MSKNVLDANRPVDPRNAPKATNLANSGGMVAPGPDEGANAATGGGSAENVRTPGKKIAAVDPKSGGAFRHDEDEALTQNKELKKTGKHPYQMTESERGDLPVIVKREEEHNKITGDHVVNIGDNAKTATQVAIEAAKGKRP